MQEFLIIIIVVVIVIIILIIIVSLLGTKQHNLNTVKHRTNVKGRQYDNIYSSREPVERLPCSDVMNMLRRLINCGIIIIILLFMS